MSLKPKQVDFNQTWNLLQETVQCVITLGNVPRSTWMDRFSDIYSMCVAYPEPLADKLYYETKMFLDRHVAHILENIRESGEQNLLNSYFTAWTEYSQGIDYMHRLYLYLNQQHIRKQKLSEAEMIYGSYDGETLEQMEIGELGLEIWKRQMIIPLRTNLVSLLLEGIRQDRLGNTYHTSADVMRGVIQSFVAVEEYKKKQTLDLYVELFETDFLTMTGEWYMSEANKLLQTCDVSQYMERVLQCLTEESMRSVRFLHVSSYPKVKAKCEKHMVADHLNFLQGECVHMVAEERKKDLSNMYPLLKSTSKGINVLIDTVREHIRKQGLEAIGGLLGGENVPTQFVENMLAVHKKYKTFIQVHFNGDQSFMGALDRACSSVINHRFDPKLPTKSPEYLAKYCDTLLKKSSKGLTESEIDDKLTQSITIFKYIDDKDIFQTFYSKMLAKRLIHQQSHSMDCEESMINKLKQACGYEFTNKLHRMFTDINISAGLNEKFHNEFVKKDNIDLGIHFSINILQAGSWPLGQTAVSSFTVPQELEKCLHSFESFYHGQFNGRKLTWLHNICQVELKIGYLKKPYLITMQTFQMAILLLFEKTDSMTCSEIQNMLQINSDQFGRLLVSLVDCKLVSASSQEFKDDTVISLNFNYSNKRTKLKISAAAQKETPQEVERTVNSVDEDRKLYLQAAIVRIMKSRKLIKHNSLIQEVLCQIKSFAPSISLIKKCIESLIDKNYVERTPNTTDEYSYVA